MRDCLFAGLVLALAGCASGPVPDKLSGGSDGEDSLTGEARPSELMKYGVWIGKGPKILASDGTLLTNARVVFGNDPTAEGLPIDADGRVVIHRYASNVYSRGSHRHQAAYGNVTVSCPGYHSAVNVSLFEHNRVVKEIRLKPLLGQTPCRTFSSEATIFCEKGDSSCGFDLVQGDWLPPYGWGRVEDLRVTVSTNLSSEVGAYSVSFDGIRRIVNRDDRQVVRFELVREGDGFGKDGENFSDCTNRVAYCKQYERDFRGVFKVRGYYGSIDSTEIRKERSNYYVENGKRQYIRREGPEVYQVRFVGRINPVAALKGFETSTAAVSPRPPVPHPAPADFDRMVFGVSENGRAAVFFGWTKNGVRVPEIFRKGVYTTEPAKALPEVETLYLDQYTRSTEMSPIINGMKSLRTIVWIGDYDSLKVGERAFADNPKLNAVIFDGSGQDAVIAGDAFVGTATNLTALYTKSSYDSHHPWDTIVVSNVFSRMTRIYTSSRSDDNMLAPPEVDLSLGEVELPVITLDEDHLDKEYSDGRILRYRKDGFAEKVFK